MLNSAYFYCENAESVLINLKVLEPENEKYFLDIINI